MYNTLWYNECLCILRIQHSLFFRKWSLGRCFFIDVLHLAHLHFVIFLFLDLLKFLLIKNQAKIDERIDKKTTSQTPFSKKKRVLDTQDA